MSRYNICIYSLIAVSFLSAAIIPNFLAYPILEENNRFYCLAISSFFLTVFTLIKKREAPAPSVFLYLFFISFLLILLFYFYQMPWSYYIKSLSCFCLFIFFYYADINIREFISFLIPIISSFVCIILLLVKINLLNNHLQESLWFDNIAGPMLIISIGYSFLVPHINDNSLPIQLITIIVALIHCAIAIMVQSRTTILAITVINIISLCHCIKKRKGFMGVLFLFCIILLSISFLLLLVKKSDSTDGRLLIWKITLSAAFDNFLLGYGPGSFVAKYMLLQADFLQNSSNLHYANIAGNVYHPFNEFLLIFFQYGLIGLSLVITGIIYIIHKMIKLRSITLLCAVSLIIFSCLSYPSKYAFFWIVLLYVISDPELYAYKKVNARNKKAVNIIMFCSSFTLFCITLADISFNLLWGRNYKEYILGNSESLNNYSKLARYWNHDPCFLYNWAIVNYNQLNYKKCIYILEKCSIKLNDYNVEMLYGECLEHLESYNEALEHFNTCMKMCPSLLMPEYKMFEVYVLNKDNENAMKVGENIINRQLKIENATTIAIRDNVNVYLNELSLNKNQKKNPAY